MKSTILIAEDQLDIRENLTDFLTMQGYQVLSAVNGKEAFNMAVEKQPDLIISDLGMPVWDGSRLLSELQDDIELARIPVIILTAWADRQNMRQGLQGGAVDYITKPFTLAEIAEAVKSHLKRREKTDKAMQNYAMSNVLPSVLRHLPHELRTPMNGILAPSEMLMDTKSIVSPEQVVHLGEIINLSALRLLRVVENMGLFLALQTRLSSSAKSQSDEGMLSNPMDLFTRICDNALARHSFRKENLIVTGSIDSDGGVPADLEKVFEEVLDNACHYARPGSNVSVVWQDTGNSASVTIQNEGPGLSLTQLQAIDSFRQFDRDKQEQQGLGLGLYIAKGLASLNDAKVVVDSCPEGPTSVHISFPLLCGGH